MQLYETSVANLCKTSLCLTNEQGADCDIYNQLCTGIDPSA